MRSWNVDNALVTRRYDPYIHLYDTNGLLSAISWSYIGFADASAHKNGAADPARHGNFGLFQLLEFCWYVTSGRIFVHDFSVMILLCHSVLVGPLLLLSSFIHQYTEGADQSKPFASSRDVWRDGNEKRWLFRMMRKLDCLMKMTRYSHLFAGGLAQFSRACFYGGILCIFVHHVPARQHVAYF